MTHPHDPQPRTWVEPELYYARLASVHVATGALITNPQGGILLVKPTYRPHWLIPGGMADDGEPPETACARELREELGLQLPVGPLLVVDWAPPAGHRRRPILYLLFDAGVVTGEPPRPQDDELDDVAFLPVEEAVRRLSAQVAGRVPAALAAREQGGTIYRPARRTRGK
ncbi:NUDIX domain-containing protein [Nonomuraea sp. NPDC050783]|uniref:NUDIX domain-containing protein n=1 Tax=Nonomuraea sp. NPDC050783 TaxID=3154634 RepID=UPI003467A1EC